MANTRWLWAALAGGALAVSGCRETGQEMSEQPTQGEGTFSGGPVEGTGGSGDDSLLGGESPENRDGSPLQQDLSEAHQGDEEGTFSGGPGEGTGGSGDDALLGGEAPPNAEGGEAQQDLSEPTQQ